MTVAAIVLVDDPDAALADAAGRPAVRRIVETAWAGGATPIVVVTPGADPHLGAVLAGSGAVVADPPPGPVPSSARDALVRGAMAATGRIGGTDAVLAWPIGYAWVDAETVTTLIQAHGLHPDAALRPHWSGTDGWPLLLPVTALLAARPASPTADLPGNLDELLADGVTVRALELGDPGSVLDLRTPLEALPPYQGPPEPLVAPPDWGAAAAEGTDDAPVAGPPGAP